jgi:hypothetical protein
VPPLHDGVPVVVSQATPHAPHVLADESDDSHPSVSGVVVVQSAQPGAHPEYWHVVPLHVAPTLWAMSQALPQPPQFAVDVVDDSHPSKSGGVLLQSAQPLWQELYWQVLPLHMALTLCTVSQVWPQPPQLPADVIIVSHPSVSGGVALQSAHPGAHPVYMHVFPLHVAPVLCCVSQTLPHPAQLVVETSDDSHPLVSGAVWSQLAQPLAQLVYLHVLPLHVAPALDCVSHTLPQAAQLVVEVSCVSQPFVFGIVLSQSAQPAAHPV